MIHASDHHMVSGSIMALLLQMMLREQKEAHFHHNHSCEHSDTNSIRTQAHRFDHKCLTLASLHRGTDIFSRGGVSTRHKRRSTTAVMFA
jgi:hypothetical protein